MVDIEYEGLPLDYLETYENNIQAVSVEDIKRVAQKYLHPDKICILVVGNKDKFDKPLDTFGKVNEVLLE
jgi:predicted Zn-dependent peptidase